MPAILPITYCVKSTSFLYFFRRLVLDYRIDYTLEQSMVEYFSAITSHQSYWHNVDFAKFVLHQIYEGNNQEEESNSSLSTSTSGEGNKL